MQVGERHVLRVERVSVDSVVSCRPSVGDSFDVAGIHFGWSGISPNWKIVAFTTLPIPSMLNVYWARMIVMNAVKYLVTGKDPEIQKNSTVNGMPRHRWEILLRRRRQRRRRRTNTEKHSRHFLASTVIVLRTELLLKYKETRAYYVYAKKPCPIIFDNRNR